jgi:hypothetical protein
VNGLVGFVEYSLLAGCLVEIGDASGICRYVSGRAVDLGAFGNFESGCDLDLVFV